VQATRPLDAIVMVAAELAPPAQPPEPAMLTAPPGAVADTWKEALLPADAGACAVTVMVWLAFTAEVLAVNVGAAAKLLLPACENVTVQAVVPLVILIATGEPAPVLVPVPEHPPDPAIVTASPELEWAEALKLVPKVAEAGGFASIVIVWLAAEIVTAAGALVAML
jgi:hypothetical protein